MSYNVKKIEENELTEFFLNPFKKIAYYDDYVIQKIEKDHEVDCFICIDLNRRRAFRTGFIVYEKQEVIMELNYLLEGEVFNKYPFIKLCDFKSNIVDMITAKVEEIKTDKIEEFRKTEAYIEGHDAMMRQYFRQLIFAGLGTTDFTLQIDSYKCSMITRFLDELEDDDFISIAKGSMGLIDNCVEQIKISPNFIAAEILQQEIKQKVEDYLAAGKFTKREELLIDFLAKTKASGAKRFTVETISGEKQMCRNAVDKEGNVRIVENYSNKIDIEDIKSVTYKGKKIYKKA